ncbi:hypothetical protein LptCag_1981 [Leptospirillum ferriphilum]|uniref:Uncharacterized protein n=1 Tax=Leptospirillum ferriphilum TaxID=178606 RepID=A0A094YMW9_9BACT|nr:hypothetical protein LptCag_1981 [Leptospirillum ferriphilum]
MSGTGPIQSCPVTIVKMNSLPRERNPVRAGNPSSAEEPIPDTILEIPGPVPGSC